MLATDVQSGFGAAVRFLRKGLGISQEELAGRAGLHRTYVADVERGARNLSLASIEKLAQALGVSLPALFTQMSGGTDQPGEGVVDILLVEPDAREVKVTLNVLRAAAVTNRVHVFRDGAEALEFILGSRGQARRKLPRRPQLLLLDLELPGVSGLEVLGRIRDERPGGWIRVVLLARSGRQRSVAEGLRLGAQAVLVKPFSFDRFAAMVPRLKLSWSLLQSSSPAAGGS
jgi:CheY-like chemotaxis protein/DNA-binding XRE family transcriptional regulator